MDKLALINELTLNLMEVNQFNVSQVKNIITSTLINYKVKYCEHSEKDLSTSYLLSKFKEGKLAIGMSTNTLKQYEIAVNTLEKLTGKNLGELESEDLNNFFISYAKKVSLVTVKNKYQLLSSIYNYLYERKYINQNPINYVNPPKADIIVKQQLSETQLESIFEHIEALPHEEYLRGMAIIHFFISTGCRISELVSLKIKDVNFQRKVAIVMGKGRKERVLILNDPCIYRLQLYLEYRENKELNSPLFSSLRHSEKPITKDAIRMFIDKLKILTGNPKLTAHTFRRFYATKLRKRGVPLQMIASSLGHSNLNTVERYSLFNNAEMIDTIHKAL